MASRIKGVRNVFRTIEKRIGKATGVALRAKIGAFTVDRIRAAARSRKNLKRGGLLPKLSKSYRDMRMGIVKFRTIKGRVIPFQEPDPILMKVDSKFFEATGKRSNLTLTGKLMKALRSTVTKTEIIIDLSNHRPGENLTNNQILKFLVKLNPDYSFIGLDSKGVKRIVKMVKEQLRREFKKFRKK